MAALTLNAVAFRQDGVWIAQCLEHDLVGCAETLDELPDELMRQVTALLRADLEAGRQPFSGFGPAPDRFWKMYEKARTRVEPRHPAASLPVETHLYLAA